MCFLYLVLGMLAGFGLVVLIWIRLDLYDVLENLISAVQKLHGSASHLDAALAQLREEWLAQQAQTTSDQKHSATARTYGTPKV